MNFALSEFALTEDLVYFELLLVLSSTFAKIRVFKVDNFVLPLILAPKLRSVAQIEWKKHPYIFSTFGSNINEFDRKKSEKNGKIQKT